MAASAAINVPAVLRDMARVVQAPEFNGWRAGFVAEHLDQFEYGDENRLAYTPIHAAYCEGVEAALARSLPPGVSMDAFSAALQEQLRGGVGDEAGEAISVLLQAGDFAAFKEMMLFEKAKLDDPSAAQRTPAADASLQHTTADGVPVIEAMLALCAQLQSAASSDGWENVLTTKWMKIDKQPVPEARRSSKSELYLRGVWTMELSFAEACDMMFTFDERRQLWDVNSRGCEALRGDPRVDDDVVVTAKLDFGVLLHLAGVPKRLTTRSILRWDFPSPGVVTYALAPWDADTDSYDPNSILKLKTGTIAPHPSGDPQRCLMTTLETNNLGGVPKWLLGGLLSYTAPQMMKGLEQRYIKNVREQGKSVRRKGRY